MADEPTLVLTQKLWAEANLLRKQGRRSEAALLEMYTFECTTLSELQELYSNVRCS